MTGDLIYAGDVTKWQQLANSLRLRFAMRISSVNPTKAQTEFENALAANGGLIIAEIHCHSCCSATTPLIIQVTSVPLSLISYTIPVTPVHSKFPVVIMTG